MAELHPELAKETAQSARQFLAAFAQDDFGEFAKPGPHDRRHLATALDYVEQLSAMVLNLAERIQHNTTPQPVEVCGG